MLLSCHNIFILERQTQAVGTDGEQPFLLTRRRHGQSATHIPGSERRLVADEGNPFARRKMGSLHAEKERAGKKGHSCRLSHLHSRRNLIGCRVAIRVVGPVAPVVVEKIGAGIVGREEPRHGIPFASKHAHLFRFAPRRLALRWTRRHDIVGISELFAASTEDADAFPHESIRRFQGDAMPIGLAIRRKEAKLHLQALSPIRSVFNRKM